LCLGLAVNNNLDEQIEKFFQSKVFGVVGASADRKKYGNKVLRCYLQHNKEVYPVHNTEKTIENIPCINFMEEIVG
jgi:predicted CoA-binding protein